MKILYIHNKYAKPSGEEHAADEIVALLQEHGHEVRWFTRSSAEIANSLTGQIKSFFTGIYNPASSRRLAKVLDEYQPDIVQVQNLYPLLSVSIFSPLRKRGIPVVMRCPNYRLFCPNGLCLDNSGEVCEKCFGRGKESWCIRKNCEKSIFKSTGYALRNGFARISKQIFQGVNVFIVQSDFQKQKFIKQGIPAIHIGILPGISPKVKKPINDVLGEWVSFVGRVSVEKGIDEFIAAARLLPQIPFKVAGNLDDSFVIPNDLPKNLEFVGFKKGEELNSFYSQSRIIVVPSKWYEGFPNVILRAMMLERPVITTRIGAMQSIIDQNKDGILVTPGCVEELSKAIELLYYNTDRCIKMGKYGLEKAMNSYSREEIYRLLMQIYQQAKKLAKK